KRDTKMKKRPRNKAICIVRKENSVLLIDTHAPDNPEFRVCVPFGGGVDFGEHSRDAAARETLEELGAVVINLRRMDVIENMFTYKDELYHEVLFAWEGEFEDKTLYEKEEIQGVESTGEPFICRWIDVELIKDEKVFFFPKQLIPLL
ncbi:MAG: NUDIX domain-containing protein, partial [Chloroflexota bacterium]